MAQTPPVPILFSVSTANAGGALRTIYIVATDISTAQTLAAATLSAGWSITGLQIVAGWGGSPTLVVQSGL